MKLMGEYAHRSPAADEFIMLFLGLNTVKLLPMVALGWGLWFEANRRQNKSIIIAGLMGLSAAFAFGRLLQDLLPYRPRPIDSGEASFVLPFSADPLSLAKWSSFPSDHAVISFALATIVFRISRPLGIACYFWSIFIVCLPRVYGGLHYASDVVAGAFIGAAIVALIQWFMLPQSKIIALKLRRGFLVCFAASRSSSHISWSPCFMIFECPRGD